MADQFADLGFDLSRPNVLDEFFTWGMERKEMIDLEDGLYVRWRTAPGIQCCLSLEPETQALLDWEIHFATDHQNGVALDGDLETDEAGQSGVIRVCLHPGEEGEIPLCAAVPALAFWPDREPGAPGLVQFAVYPTVLALCPAGTAEHIKPSESEPVALLTGTVVGCHSCVNEFTHGHFWHVEMSCCGCIFDVLCADNLFATPLEKGTVIQVEGKITATVESGVTG